MLDISERRACRYLCANRRMVRYVGPRGPLKSGQPWPLENRPEVGGHLKIGHG
jgi:hypothetical protein